MTDSNDVSLSSLERGGTATKEYKCHSEKPVRVLSIEQHATPTNLGQKMKLSKETWTDFCHGCREENKNPTGGHGAAMTTGLCKIDGDMSIYHPRAICEDDMMRMQEMVRKDMSKELDELISKLKADGNAKRETERESYASCASKMSNSEESTLVEKEGIGEPSDSPIVIDDASKDTKAEDDITHNIYRVKFTHPLKISGRNTSKNPSPDTVPNRIFDSSIDHKFDAEIKVTLLQMAIIAGSLDSMSTIMNHLGPKDIIPALQEKLEMIVIPKRDSEYQKSDLTLHGMNAFHLMARYCPLEIEKVHEFAKKRLRDLGNQNVSCAAQQLPRVETDDKEGGRVDTFSDSTKDKKIPLSHPKTKLRVQLQNICYGKRLIELQMLLGENNVLKQTPLSIAIDNFDSHQESDVIR